MWGGILGDVIGSIYENAGKKTMYFPLFEKTSTFTDDTVMNMATIDVLLNGLPYAETYKLYGQNYPNRGYGRGFRAWIDSHDLSPYNSFGNGSAMRVLAIGYAFETLYEVLAEAKASAEVTHNHPEGIKGAEAVASTVFLARKGKSKAEIREYLRTAFGYDMYRTIEEIRPNYTFSAHCQTSVPEAIIAFLDSKDWLSSVRLAISLGGDADTQACIAGGIAEAFYKEIPYDSFFIGKHAIPKNFKNLLSQFYDKYEIQTDFFY